MLTRRTLLILDYDDSLVCSTFLCDKIENYSGHFTNEEKEKISALEEASVRLIKAAIAFDNVEVVVISNAKMNWLKYSLSQYFPHLLRTLREEKIRIVSARESYENMFPFLAQWKLSSFLYNILQFKEKVGNCVSCSDGVLIVSIGDGPVEQIALKQIGLSKGIPYKTIKMIHEPGPIDLSDQLNFITDNLLLVLSQEPRHFEPNERVKEQGVDCRDFVLSKNSRDDWLILPGLSFDEESYSYQQMSRFTFNSMSTVVNEVDKIFYQRRTIKR